MAFYPYGAFLLDYDSVDQPAVVTEKSWEVIPQVDDPSSMLFDVISSLDIEGGGEGATAELSVSFSFDGVGWVKVFTELGGDAGPDENKGGGGSLGLPKWVKVELTPSGGPTVRAKMVVLSSRRFRLREITP